ncbi:MAG: hypothetical protein PVJ67_03975 [Candidatus Pacearchaeota archaeon]|jgi:hypothetical protein
MKTITYNKKIIDSVLPLLPFSNKRLLFDGKRFLLFDKYYNNFVGFINLKNDLAYKKEIKIPIASYENLNERFFKTYIIFITIFKFRYKYNKEIMYYCDSSCIDKNDRDQFYCQYITKIL